MIFAVAGPLSRVQPQGRRMLPVKPSQGVGCHRRHSVSPAFHPYDATPHRISHGNSQFYLKRLVQGNNLGRRPVGPLFKQCPSGPMRLSAKKPNGTFRADLSQVTKWKKVLASQLEKSRNARILLLVVAIPELGRPPTPSWRADGREPNLIVPLGKPGYFGFPLRPLQQRLYIGPQLNEPLPLIRCEFGQGPPFRGCRPSRDPSARTGVLARWPIGSREWWTPVAWSRNPCRPSAS